MEIPKNNNGTNNWVQYRRLVLSELEKARADIRDISDEQIKIRLDIRELKVRSAIWGGVAGLIGGTALSLIVSLII